MMAPREQAVLKAPSILGAEQDIKNIANKMGKKMMRREEYKGDDVDFTQHAEKRMWRGRLGRRGPLRQRQDEAEQEQAQGFQEVRFVSCKTLDQ
jgi:hypothetical protein